MTTAQAVIGLGFGDEGKGLVTDYLCSKADNPIVVRYSGGQQAGHTVVRDNAKHVFSNFGSGTLQGIPTYWSKYCSVDPEGILNELDALKTVMHPAIYDNLNLIIDPRAPVTTPYDKYHNQNSRTYIDHGTCGVGVGATFQRQEDHYRLEFGDLKYEAVLRQKLSNIKSYYGYTSDFNIEDFISCCQQLLKLPHIAAKTEEVLLRYDSTIFEGSQGLLLDQDIGFFPHVTRSNVGTKNILSISSRSIKTYLVTRCYQPRHGNGPMTNTDFELVPIDNTSETNDNNKYQGEFRKTVLDLDLLNYGLEKDPKIRNLSPTLVITCMDQPQGEFQFTHQGRLHSFAGPKEYARQVAERLHYVDRGKVLISEGPTAQDIKDL